MSHTIEIQVTVVPKAVQLREGTIYLFRDGKLLDCGTLECLLGHLDAAESRGVNPMETLAVRDHFDGQYGAQDGPHVLQVELT